MNKKNITLFFLPSTGKSLKKINLTKSKLIFLSLILFVFFFGFIYIVFDYISLKHQSFENLMLRTENNALQRKITTFQTKMAKIEDTLNRINTFATKLKTITKLEDPERLQRLAIGPISKYDYDTMTHEKGNNSLLETVQSPSDLENDNDSLSQIDQKLKLLQHASSLQEQNLSQLQELLEDQKSLLKSLPSIHPTNGWITSGFGPRISPFTGLRVFHEGVDIGARTGTIIQAPADGLVTFSGFKPGYGNVIAVDHGYGIMTKYAHNSVNYVKAGDKISRGQRIATVGNTGRSTGPHLHYEVLINGIPRNPKDYILNYE